MVPGGLTHEPQNTSSLVSVLTLGASWLESYRTTGGVQDHPKMEDPSPTNGIDDAISKEIERDPQTVSDAKDQRGQEVRSRSIQPTPNTHGVLQMWCPFVKVTALGEAPTKKIA